jgi:ketosteroid isomerase-like protein
MSQENVEMIRAAMNAWNRGDWDDALTDAAPDFVLDNSMNAGEWRGIHRGPEEVKRAWGVLTEAWQSVRIEVSEFIEADGGVVVTRQKAHFVGRDGIDLPGPTRSGWVWTIRDGKLAHLTTYNDLDEALQAVGLSES